MSISHNVGEFCFYIFEHKFLFIKKMLLWAPNMATVWRGFKTFTTEKYICLKTPSTWFISSSKGH